MNKFCFFKMFETGCIIAAVILAGSCVSRSPAYTDQTFGVIGAEADMYVFIPVSGNEPLLKAVLTLFVPEKAAEQYLNRTSVLCGGVQYNPESSVTIASAGAYPVSLGDLLFSKKDGWEKHRATVLDNRSYYSSAAADVVLREKNAFALLGADQRNTAAFLQRIAEPRETVLPPRFRALSVDGGTDTIGLYIRSGGRIMAAFLGLQDIELPIGQIEFYLKKNTDSNYRCSAVFEAVDDRSALILKRLLAHSMTGDFSVQDSSVFVENADITETVLIKMLQGILILDHF